MAVLAITSLIALVLRWLLRLPSAEPGEGVPDLSPYEVACLGGGPDLAVHTGIASLVHRGVLAVQTTERALTVQGPLPSKAPQLEQVIYNAVGKSGETISKVRADALAALDKYRERLQEAGLIVADEKAFLARAVPGLLPSFMTILGVAKILVGLNRGRPVGFLVILTIVALVVTIVFFAKRPLRSRRGDRVLAQLQEENAALRSTAARGSKDLGRDDLILALGLFGMGIIATGPIADLRTALRPPPSSGTGCGGSSCGGGGCGGGGCGGGCGGGGCGGCGS